MDIEALWSVVFQSNSGDIGAGVVVLETGRVLGGDAQFTYVGTYRIDQNGTLNADVEVKQHTAIPGQVSIFGPITHFHLVLSGPASHDTITVSGHMKQNPALKIGIRFTRRAELPNPA